MLVVLEVEVAVAADRARRDERPSLRAALAHHQRPGEGVARGGGDERVHDLRPRRTPPACQQPLAGGPECANPRAAARRAELGNDARTPDADRHGRRVDGDHLEAGRRVTRYEHASLDEEAAARTRERSRLGAGLGDEGRQECAHGQPADERRTNCHTCVSILFRASMRPPIPGGRCGVEHARGGPIGPPEGTGRLGGLAQRRARRATHGSNSRPTRCR